MSIVRIAKQEAHKKEKKKKKKRAYFNTNINTNSHLPPSGAVLFLLLFCFVAGILVFLLRNLLFLDLVLILS
jgi:hypothetical protein